MPLLPGPLGRHLIVEQGYGHLRRIIRKGDRAELPESTLLRTRRRYGTHDRHNYSAGSATGTRPRTPGCNLPIIFDLCKG